MSVRYLDLADALHIADRVVEGEVLLRDVGLLDAALARPRATVFGKQAYPDLHEKAAALLHSVARNHALVDGDQRLALAGTIAFLGINGWRLTLTEDEAYDLVVAVAAGELDEVAPIAERLRTGGEPRPLPSR